jgi:hypothetical protein
MTPLPCTHEKALLTFISLLAPCARPGLEAFPHGGRSEGKAFASEKSQPRSRQRGKWKKRRGGRMCPPPHACDSTHTMDSFVCDDVVPRGAGDADVWSRFATFSHSYCPPQPPPSLHCRLTA